MMPLTVKSYKFLLILFWVYLSLSNSSAWCQATRTFDDTLKILNQTQLNPQHQIFSKLANQGDPVAKAKEISLRVQRLLKDQQFSGATKLLDQGLEECAATGQSAKKCQAILYFNYGYLYEQWAAQNRSQKGALLNKSVANYRNVLQIFPDQPQAIYNLVLVLQQLQRDQEAVELLTGAIENDPDRAYTYHLMLGKIFYKNDAIPKALTSFRNAAKLEPFKETAHRHILRCYPKMTVDSLENLLGYSLQLKDYQLPQLAMEGLEQIFSSGHRANEAVALKALVSWAHLGGQQGWISQESLAKLPQQRSWQSPALTELRELIENPLTAGKNLGWWQSTPWQERDYWDKKTSAAALVMKSIADRQLLKGNYRNASAIYEVSIRLLQLHTESSEYFAIARELARLYHVHPKLDPKGEKIRNLTRELFTGKTMAYQEMDPEAIYNYHTTLGIIYAERGEWLSRWPAANAIFQLENALKYSPRGQPEPYLRGLLAGGYQSTGMTYESAHTYMQAAQDYLDVDDLEKAAKMLRYAEIDPAQIHTISGKRDYQEDLKKIGQLKNILTVRRHISAIPADQFDGDIGTYFEQKPELSWLLPGERSELDENFIQRQKFKTLTDLAERASRLPNQSGARLLYTQALDEATETHSLIGMSDILRLEKIKSAISKTVQIGNAGNSIQLYSSKESRMATTDGKEWQVTSTSGNESMKIRISSDLVVAGRVVNSFSRLSAADSYVPYIFLNNGSLKLFKEQQPEEEILKTAKFLEGIEGVKNIEVLK